MNLEDSKSGSEPVPPELPFALSYGTAAPSRPAVIVALGIIGIIVAALGLLAAAYGALTVIGGVLMRSAMPAMQWQTSAALAVTLMTRSIGLLRLQPWSRRVLLWWAWVYIATALLFVLLQVLIVVPSQVAGITNMMRTMPVAAPATMPVGGGTWSTTSTSISFSTTTGGGGVAVVGSPAAAGGLGTPQMMSMMSLTYLFMAIGKTVICLIFPIVLLVMLQTKAVRSVLAG
jgi:hypothetical protein